MNSRDVVESKGSVEVSENRNEAFAKECRSLGVVAKNTIDKGVEVFGAQISSRYEYYARENKCIFETYYIIRMTETDVVESGEMTDLFTGEVITQFMYSPTGKTLLGGNYGSCMLYEELRMLFFGDGLKYCGG